jgi:RNA polymerase sigma factor (sigma-70 family)
MADSATPAQCAESAIELLHFGAAVPHTWPMAATAVHVRSPDPARRRRLLLHVGDDRLVARVRAGDDAAFEIIYDRYYRGLLAFCGHMLGSRQEAEDALQHSFASAYRALRHGAGDIDLRPWLYTIARNRCLSALRAQRAQVCVGPIAAGAGPFEGMPAQIQQRADLRDLVEDLQRLPDDQRAALVLFELGDESHEQIAAVLGVRREKVKALVFQAREALLRAREARDAPCVEIREQLAILSGRVPRRSMLRSHIERCPGCAQFEREVRHQRAALAAILPLAPTVGLKTSVLGFALGGGGGAVALGGAGAGGGATVAAGGAFAAGGVGGGGAVGTAGTVAASALGTAGAATVASGLATSAGGGLASLPAKGVVAKILAVVALGGGGAEAQVHTQRPSQPAAAHQFATPPSPAASAPSYPPAAARPSGPATPSAHEPTPSAPSTSSAPAPAVPSPSHAPASPTPDAAPATSEPSPGGASPSVQAAPTPSDAPAATPPADAAPAPSAPAASAAAPATTDDGAPPPAPPAATATASEAPASQAPTDATAATTTAAPAAPDTAAAAASAATVAAS